MKKIATVICLSFVCLSMALFSVSGQNSAAGPAANKPPQNVLYAELTPQEFRDRLAAAPIAYLPLGTLEWHGEHLPLGSDGLQSYGFFIGLAGRRGR